MRQYVRKRARGSDSLLQIYAFFEYDALLHGYFCVIKINESVFFAIRKFTLFLR